MTNEELVRHLKNQGACDVALQWLNGRDRAQMWAECERPDWLLWYATRNGASHKQIVRVVCDIARTVLHFVPKGEERPRIAIETAEAWLEGKATLEQVRAAYTNATVCASDWTDRAAAASRAAWAAACVSWAASTPITSRAAEAAEAATCSVAYVTRAAGAGAAKSSAWAAGSAQNEKSCGIIRTMWPTCPNL